MNSDLPSYLYLHKKGELERRIDALYALMSPCVLCGHHCEANREEGGQGFCKAPSVAVYSSSMPHGGEEKPLSGNRGSGTIFLAFCNSRCVFCQNYDISQLAHGEIISVEELAKHYLRLQNTGCHNINFVTPAHFLPHLVAALVPAIDNGFSLPLVYNSNGYDSVEVLKLLDGIIDIYLPDMKYSNSKTAQSLSRLPKYPSISKAAVKEMYRQVGVLETDESGIAQKGLIIRHLVLPNDLSGTKAVLKWISDLDDRIHISLMGQYYPAYQAVFDDQLNRRITWDEYNSAKEYAKKIRLQNVWTQDVFLSVS